jgi:hypothetical protein
MTIGAALAPGAAYATASFTIVNAQGATNDAMTSDTLRLPDASAWHIREPHCYKAGARFFKCRISRDRADHSICTARYDVRMKVRALRPTARRTSLKCS